jgi:hypothetical protein
MTESPSSQPDVTDERIFSVVWSSLGVACAWILYSAIMVFVIGQFEPMLGGPSATFAIMVACMVVALPLTGIGTFGALIFLRRVIRAHRTRLFAVNFVGGIVALGVLMALAALHPVEWWESLCILAIATMVVQWCMVSIAMKSGILCAALPNVCSNCGYPVGASDVCSECGAAHAVNQTSDAKGRP